MKIVFLLLFGLAVAHQDSAESVPYNKIKVAVYVRPDPAHTIPDKYADMIAENAERNGVPVWIVARMIEWESGWNPRRKSQRNANGSYDYGLMQLNSRYLDEYSWKYNEGEEIDPYDPETNIRVGVRYLSHLRAHTASWYEALWAYNAGLSRVRAQKMPETTLNYLRFVFQEGL